jgi:hypothetical protein
MMATAHAHSQSSVVKSYSLNLATVASFLPSFPSFLLNGTRPTWAAWILKKDMLPAIYWHAMLKGREWLAAPKKLKSLKG